MSKKLIVCNTVYQLYNAINLRQNVFNELDRVDIIITDRTDFGTIIEKLRKTSLFENVYFVEINKFYSNYLYKNKVVRYLVNNLKVELIFKEYYIRRLFQNEPFNGQYDEMYFSNHDTFSDLLYNYLYKNNSSIRIFEFEDGFGTYVRPLRNEKFNENDLLIKLFALLNIKFILPSRLIGAYLYEPELYCWKDDIPKIKMPKFDKNSSDDIKILNEIFNYSLSDYFDKKFILLEESFYADKIRNNDYELFSKIIELLGENSVLVKLHPRNRVNRFDRYSELKVFNKPVPWEVITINESFDDKVLVTITSSTVFTPILLYDAKCKIISLYKLLEGYNPMFDNSNTEEYLIKAKGKFQDQMLIPDSMEELFKIIRSL